LSARRAATYHPAGSGLGAFWNEPPELMTMAAIPVPSILENEPADLTIDLAPQAPVSGAIVDLAILFTDLEGYTAYTAHHGDLAAAQAIQIHVLAAGGVLRRRGGRIVKQIGDGLMIVFLDPAAAVLAGVELVPTSPAGLRLRAGIHWGRALVTGSDVLGHAVNVAARVAACADGGEVLVSADTAACCGEVDGVRFGIPRRYALRGIDAPIDLHLAAAA
jgi:adenylate cyclase